jgi:aminoglycoside 2'-N-acetyltransferase I
MKFMNQDNYLSEVRMKRKLDFKIIHSSDIDPKLKARVIALCNRAYGEELRLLFKTFRDATHVLGFMEGSLVSHAMWVTRWLQPGNSPLLRTAYVEMVATKPENQREGFATAIMRRLASTISAFDLGALSPADTTLYSRLGWVFWRGPLFIRYGVNLIATSNERIMVLRLPGTPRLEMDEPISAEWREGELW